MVCEIIVTCIFGFFVNVLRKMYLRDTELNLSFLNEGQKLFGPFYTFFFTK